jgi:hypothetical protein
MARCPLTGRPVPIHQVGDSLSFFYETPETGKVLFTEVALTEAENLTTEEKQILAGICRNRTIRNEEPIMITSAFLKTLKQQNIPFAFQERAIHFLKYLYDNGGKEFKSFDIDSRSYSTIAYAGREEFERIIKHLKSEFWIEIGQEFAGAGAYHNLTLTKYGIEEVEKGKPKMPLFGLVSQEISAGDPSIDSLIEQARKAFFAEPTSLESKRSACETLSYVLEPLRKELDGMFEGDTDCFFRIVNEFSVRHNKPSTKKINSEELLEWIFYSLLNTINTYYKMKRKTI